MSGIDYQALRMTISMEHVLRLLNYNPSYRRGEQLRGACPIHDPSALGEPRCFSVHLGRGLFRCFACAAGGNQLDLWAQLHHLTLYHAACDLCQRAGVGTPLISSRSAGR